MIVMHFFFLQQSNDLKLVEALVVFDADVNSLNITKMSPMDHAYLHKNEVQHYTCFAQAYMYTCMYACAKQV